MRKNTRDLTDEELLRRYKKSGDLEVLGVLYKRYMHLVYGVCLKYFKDRQRSQDGVSEIFEQLIAELGKRDVENFKSWLYVVTKNHCLMALRKDKSRHKQFSDFSAQQFMESTREMHPVDALPDEKMETALRECLKKLKDEQKQCVQLFYYQQKCYREIAGELEIEEKKVKSYIQNGKRNLKICLEHQQKTDE